MSCQTCGGISPADCTCSPCAQVITTEGLASAITNLQTNLFGDFTITVVNGRGVWTQICSPNSAGLTCFPRGTTEGFICYILRILASIGTFAASVHNPASSYCKNTMVASGSSLYMAIQDVPGGIAITNVAYWLLLITAPAGATGPQGAPGASGSGSATNYATQVATVTLTLGNTGAVVFCQPAGIMTVNLPLIASVDSGKWYKIWTNGAFAVTITPNGAQTINGGGSITLNVANEAVELVSNNLTDWRIL